MRFEELTYEIEGREVTVPLHPRLTVIAGLDSAARHQWAQRLLGILHGTPPGHHASLVLLDGAGRRFRLTRGPGGATTTIDLESGEDLSAARARDGHLDWMALLELSPEAARAVMIVRAPASEEPAAGGGEEELLETREALAHVEAECEETRAGRQAAEALKERLACVEDNLREAPAAPAEAAQPPAGAGPEWRRAVEALQAARDAFGDRLRLEPAALERGLLLPTQPPGGLEELHRAYVTAARRRAEARARLEEAAPATAPPSAPWLPTLARLDRPELWARAERLRSARSQVAEICLSAGEGDRAGIVPRIEAAHAEVEKAERHVEGGRFTSRAARQRLTRAQEAEREILAGAGFGSWLGFQLQRVDVLVEPDTRQALQAAEAELEHAAEAWAEMAGVVDVDTALAAREEVESYAAHLARADSGATAAVRQEMEDADAAYGAARAALLDVCAPFAVEPTNAPQEIAALVAGVAHARLQQDLEEAEAAERAARQDSLSEERARLLEELAAAEPDPARAAGLIEHRDALRRRVSVLEASTRPLPTEDPEMALLGRFAVARRVGPGAEPIPLIVDDALAPFPRDHKESLLELLTRLGEAAQVVYLTDDPETVQWAETRRGDMAVLGAAPASDGSPPPPTVAEQREEPSARRLGGCDKHLAERAVVACGDCGRAACSICVVQLPGAGSVCTGCALVRAGVRRRSSRR